MTHGSPHSTVARAGTWLVLFAHGSADPAWRRTCERIAARVGQAWGAAGVRLAYLERARPSLAEVASEAAARSVETLVVLPLFLSSGGHVARDLPPLAADVALRHPGLEVSVLGAVGDDPRFAELVATLAGEVLELAPPPETSGRS